MKRLATLFTLLALMLTVTVSTGFAATKGPSAAKIKEAENFYQQGLALANSAAPDAIKLLDKAIAANPEKAEYYFKRGVLWKQSGNTEKGFSDYRKAVVLNPDQYFNKIFGGTKIDGSTYKDNFLGYTISTKSVKVAAPSAPGLIKAYLKKYKGDKVKNAQAIIDAATEGSLSTLEVSTADQLGYAQISMIMDFPGTLMNSEVMAKGMAEEFKKTPGVSDVKPAVKEILGGHDAAYVEFNQLTEGVNVKCRVYALSFDNFAYSITACGSDDAHLSTIVNDFVKTISIK